MDEGELLVLLSGIGTNVLVLIFGLMMMFKPPEMNHSYGYRTKNSLKSEENWIYAQKTSGRYILISMIILFLIRIVLFLLDLWSFELEVILNLSIGVICIAVLFIIENKLKKIK